MIQRPESHGERYAARFQDQSVVDRYHMRPTYPPETFAILNALIVDEPRAVLDVGCGTGNVARPLAEYVERIDAVDMSFPMLERARTLPGGDSPKIRWLHGRAEDVELQPPYTLVTAGESLHWMDWAVILPRFARILTPHGMLAIVHTVDQPVPWREGYLQIVRRFSILSLETMTAGQAAQFDAEMHALLRPFAQDGQLTLSIVGGITWGRPLSGGFDPEHNMCI